MSIYYVFEDEQTAIGAEAYICQIAQTPMAGYNLATGELEPSKTKTERWAIPEQRLDGKWVFQVIPDVIASQYPPEVASAFNVNFPNTREEYDRSWFPAEE